jgi:hypothetical protein
MEGWKGEESHIDSRSLIQKLFLMENSSFVLWYFSYKFSCDNLYMTSDIPKY